MSRLASRGDGFWQPWPTLADAALREWLLDDGSLTARIRARCSTFGVRVLRQQRMKLPREEATVLGLHARELAIGRDVLLQCGSVPVVFAHSVVRAADLRAPWRAIASMGTNPLGAALFADPRIERLPLAFRRLKHGHPLYSSAAAAVDRPLPALWARRSIFVSKGAPLLVSEVFLPDITNLPSTITNRT